MRGAPDDGGGCRAERAMTTWHAVEVAFACVAILLFLGAGALGELTDDGRHAP